MSALEDMYAASSDPLVVGARNQAAGKLGDNFFDTTNEFSMNFTPRTPGNTNVIISNDSSVNDGNFTSEALGYLNVESQKLPEPGYFKPATPYKQWSPANKYVDAESSSPGAAYQY